MDVLLIVIYPPVFALFLLFVFGLFKLSLHAIRSGKFQNSKVKRRATQLTLVISSFLLLVPVLQTTVNATFYIVGVGRIAGLSAKYSPVFETVFDYAQRCRSSGSIDQKCSHEYIHNMITTVAGDPPKSNHMKLFVEPMLARVAVDERVEFLNLHSGEFFSLDTTNDSVLASLRADMISGSKFLNGSNWKRYLFNLQANDNWWEKKWSHELIYHPSGKALGAFVYTEWYEESDFLFNAPAITYLSPFILLVPLFTPVYGFPDGSYLRVMCVVWISLVLAILITRRVTRGYV